MNYWLEHCEVPREKPDGIEWDVFISYRSLDRTWAIALYDMFSQCNYKVFMDQFVLVAGKGLATQLSKNLARSNSGVLLWSQNASDSEWVDKELNAMESRSANTAKSPNPFHFVVAVLDSKKPPELSGGTLYLDFSEYPDGPMGTDIVRLTSGLQGKSLSPPAVARMVEYEKAMKEEPVKLRASAKAKRFDEILGRIKSDDAAYTTSATLLGLAVDQLIRGKQYLLALDGVEVALKRFPSSLRLRQLRGLALRRNGQLDDAIYRLSELTEQGHEDPETLGILAAVHADLWEKRLSEGNKRDAKDALELSRNLYRDAFAKVPSDTYVGINAASKTALLGDLDAAKPIAQDVLKRLGEARQVRGGSPSTDFWERVTEPEALLIIGEHAKALALYHDARIAHQSEVGSIESTGKQVRRLLGVLPVAPDIRQALLEEFGLDTSN